MSNNKQFLLSVLFIWFFYYTVFNWKDLQSPSTGVLFYFIFYQLILQHTYCRLCLVNKLEDCVVSLYEVIIFSLKVIFIPFIILIAIDNELVYKFDFFSFLLFFVIFIYQIYITKNIFIYFHEIDDPNKLGSKSMRNFEFRRFPPQTRDDMFVFDFMVYAFYVWILVLLVMS